MYVLDLTCGGVSKTFNNVHWLLLHSEQQAEDLLDYHYAFMTVEGGEKGSITCKYSLLLLFNFEVLKQMLSHWVPFCQRSLSLNYQRVSYLTGTGFKSRRLARAASLATFLRLAFSSPTCSRLFRCSAF